MAQIVSWKVRGHNNIYMSDKSKASYGERELEIEIGIPENGIDDRTCMIVLIPGYGGSMDSNIFRKMRHTFPELYNVVVVQCDYFGNKFMQQPTHLSILPEEYGKNGNVYTMESGETIEEFNDMGIMQALDIVNATLSSMQYIEQKWRGRTIKNVILFGSSHGAYVAHLANLICPGLYFYLLDISAYMKPYYIEHPRYLDLKPTKDWSIELEIYPFLYLHPEVRYHEKLYDLRFLYHTIQNRCRIICFQGTEDWMVDCLGKMQLIKEIGKTAQLMLIRREDVDGELCKNASHGLGMDFLVLFQMLMPMLQRSRQEGAEEVCLPKTVVLGDANTKLCIDYESGLPELKYITFDK